MKKLILPFVLLCLLASNVQAGIMLSTSNPSGDPLIVSSGTTMSGPIYVTVTSLTNDVMGAWGFELVIMSEGGTGTLTFQDPTTGTPSNPPSYIFGSNGYGIYADNEGITLTANDEFTTQNSGVQVTAAGANLLQMDFNASGASGLFGIYAVDPYDYTNWSDAVGNVLYFSNVPNGSDPVLIGEVDVTGGTTQAVPEPASLTLVVIGGMTLGAWRWLCMRKQAAV